MNAGWTSIRDAIVPPLERDVEAAFAEDLVDANLWRLRGMTALMAVIHAFHVAHFWVSPAERATLAAHAQLWRDSLVAVHGITAVVAALFSLWLWTRGKRGLGRFAGALTSAIWLGHAVAITAVDQLGAANVVPYVAYCLGIAVVAILSPLEAVLVYLAALVGFVAVLQIFQVDPEVRATLLPNGPTVTVVSIALSMFLFAGRRRDFAQRITIQRQQGLLTALNEGLEQRVREQVAEIVARADEVDRLNRQLQAQIRERSAELSGALARLARTRENPAPMVGSVLGGRFEVGEVLGAGGMGVVYRGVDRIGGDPVAIKVVQARSASELDSLRRFLREAASAATVSHPAVVKMIAVDVSAEGLFYQVQELVDGESLYEVLKRVRRFEAPVVARIGEALCTALAAAHDQGVLHRDVKPSNVMITPRAPGLKLLDFGLSRSFSTDDEDGTRTGALLGTPAFMGPEQLAGKRDLTDRTDMYAVGVTLHMLATGRHPLADPLPAGFEGDVRITEIVARCMRATAADRPSAAELVGLLGQIADDAGAEPLEQMVRGGRFAKVVAEHLHSDPTLG